MHAVTLLQGLRRAHFVNSTMVMFQTARHRAVAIGISCLVTWASIFALAYFGFWELKTRWNFPLDGGFQLVLFDIMFASLTGFLLFSSGILIYSGLFLAPESRYLLTTPVPDDHVFAYKFQGALAFSNWGFLLLGSPVLIAYGLQVEPAAPWYFFLFMPLFFLGFVLIPGSLGAIVCLLLVNFLPRNMSQVGKTLGLIGGIVALVILVRYLQHSLRGIQANRQWFEAFIHELTLLSGELMPHHWVAGGLRASALREPAQAFYYLALVWSNGLLLYVVAVAIGKRLFRRGTQRLLTGGALMGGQVRGEWLDRALAAMLFFLDSPTRLLIIKDARTFRRDPAQWLQMILPVGLLVLYFWSMGQFFSGDLEAPYRNGISLLTLCSMSLLLCAYMGRFVFPLLSLEGRAFWLLGLLPINRTRLVLGKFAFAICTCLPPSAVLIVYCDAMLGVPASMMAMHGLSLAMVIVGLAALSVGLGTILPNFRETDPSKIALGFGGTLNLLAGFLYLILVLSLMNLPLHLYQVGSHFGYDGPLPWWVWSLAGLGVLVTATATYFPLLWAARRLRTLEF